MCSIQFSVCLIMAKKILDEYFIKLHKSDLQSHVWQYFGQLHAKANKQLNEAQNIYCLPCFNSNKLKHYKDTVSTTNLSQHLREAHGMYVSVQFIFKKNKLACVQVKSEIHVGLWKRIVISGCVVYAYSCNNNVDKHMFSVYTKAYRFIIFALMSSVLFYFFVVDNN